MRGLLLWPLLAIHALAWKHVSEDALRTSLKESEYTMIAFVLPESEAGKALEPEWKALQDTSSDPDIVSFDCSANMIMCQEFDIASYPAIRLYRRDGGMHRHRGERTSSEMLAFLRRARRTPVIEVDATLVSTLLDVDNIVFLAHIGPRDNDLRDQFKALAARYRDSYSFIMTGPLQGKSALHCINNIDEEEHTTEPFATIGGLEAFVKRCSSPFMPELTRANEAEYTGTGKSLLHYFFASPAEKEKYRTEMRPLAKKYAEFLHFTLTDVNEYPEMLKLLGLKEGFKTGLSLQNPNNGDVFPYRGKKKITDKVVEQFLEDVIDGKVKALESKLKGGHDEL